MANKILIKRSNTQNGAPLVSDLSLGELAINTYDGRLFSKKDDGSASIVDLTKNAPVRLLGDASSTYAWDQNTYTSNVSMTLNTVNANVGSYGNKAGGTLTVPVITVNAKGLVTAVDTVTYSAASDLGTMAVQNYNNVSITGGTIDGTVIGGTTPADATFSNVTVNGTLYSNDITAANVTVDGSAIITGNLTVQGTTTTVNSTTVEIGDKNIVLAKDAADSATADGAGITVNGANATILYNHTGTKWELNKPLSVTGSGTFSSIVNANGGIAVDSTKFTVADGTGDIHTDGNLDVDGNSTLNGTLTVDGLINANGGIAVDTNKFTVADTTGNTYIDGTLDVKGDITNDNVSAGKVVFGDGTTGALKTDANLSYDAGTKTLTIDNVVINGTASFSGGFDLGAGPNEIVYGNSVDGKLESEPAFIYNASTNTLGVDNASINGNIIVNTNKFTVAGSTGDTTVGGTLGVSGDTTLTGDLAVNGGDLTTNQSTFNLINSTTTTLNVGGAATSVSIGAAGSTGTLTIKNDNVVLDGDLQIKGGDLTSNQTTFNLLNVTTTTLNVGGAATAVTIGAAGSSGTLTIKNDNVVVDGDLQVKGGDLTTNQSTFNLLNATATTINFGGSGTIVNIGASSGTTYIKNSGNVAGSFGVQGSVVFDNTLDVAGAATFANVVSLTTANAQATLGNYNTGSLRVLGDVSVDGDIQASGAIYKGGYEVLNTQDTIDGGTY